MRDIIMPVDLQENPKSPKPENGTVEGGPESVVDGSESLLTPESSESVKEKSEEEYEGLMGQVSELQVKIEGDKSVSPEEKGALLDKLKKVKQETQDWFAGFWKTLGEKKRNAFRKEGEPWAEDVTLAESEGREASLGSVKKEIGVVDKRLNHVRKIDKDFSFKRRKPESETALAMSSSWRHLLRAGQDFESVGVRGEKKGEKVREELKKTATEFWGEYLKKIGWATEYRAEFFEVRKMVEGISEEGQDISPDFFDNLPEVLREAFLEALMRLFSKSKKTVSRYDERGSSLLNPVEGKKELGANYVFRLLRNFQFDQLLSIVDQVQPSDTLENLTSGEKCSRPGLEDLVANMAIHRSALRTANKPDGWYGDDVETLGEVKDKTKAEPLVFLENLYASLKDHPSTLVQAFKGLLKVPTQYSISHRYNARFAGYDVYSEKEGKFVRQFDGNKDSVSGFDEINEKVNSFVFDVSQTKDYNLIWDFVIEKGKNDDVMRSVSNLFLGRVVAAKNDRLDPSEFAEKIYTQSEFENKDKIARFFQVFPNKENSQVLFQAYKKGLEGGEDFLSNVDLVVLGKIYRIPWVSKYLRDFVEVHLGDPDLAEKINKYAQQINQFSEITGEFYLGAFNVYLSQLDKGVDLFRDLKGVKIGSLGDGFVHSFFDFIKANGEKLEAPERLRWFVERAVVFKEKMGYFEKRAFGNYVERAERGQDLLAGAGKELLGLMGYPESEKEILRYFSESGGDNAVEGLDNFVKKTVALNKMVGGFDAEVFKIYQGQISKGIDLLQEVDVEKFVRITEGQAGIVFKRALITVGGTEDGALRLGELSRRVISFIEKAGVGAFGKFSIYEERLNQGVDIFENVDGVKLKSIIESNPDIFDHFFNKFSGAENAADLLQKFVDQADNFCKKIKGADAEVYNLYLARLSEGVDLLQFMDESKMAIIFGPNGGEAKPLFLSELSGCALSSNTAELIKPLVAEYSEFIEKMGGFHREVFKALRLNKATFSREIDLLAEVSLGAGSLIRNLLFNLVEDWVKIPWEKRGGYVEILKMIMVTPSQEIKRIAEQLLGAIMGSEDPVSQWKKIEAVFIKNNIPLVGKVFKILRILHPDEVMAEKLEGNPDLSPYLRQASPKRRAYTIFNDLLKINIESGNRSLRQYLEVLKDGDEFFATLDDGTEKQLSPDGQKRLRHYMMKLNTLFMESQMGSVSSLIPTGDEMGLAEIKQVYNKLRQSLGAKDGQSLPDRVVEMFAKRLGYNSVEDVLTAMKESKKAAHDRGVQYAKNAVNGCLGFADGDLLKGVNENFIPSIMQNGSVSKENLGGSADSDATPYDTDVFRISPSEGEVFQDVMVRYPAEEYGKVFFVVRDRGQFVKTSKETEGQIDPSKMELFKTGVINEAHYGIRTGFPSSEIDFIICKTYYPGPLFSEIVQNGYYIPVVDGSGKIIFTPEDYEAMRSFYDGLDRFDGAPFAYEPTQSSGSRYGEDLLGLKDQIVESKKKVEIATENIRDGIENVLSEYGVDLKDVFDTSIIGAELMDTGSTGRQTNMFDSIDFDLALKIDLTDEGKVQEMVEALRKKWQPEKDNSHAGNSESDIFQLRFEGAKVGEDLVDIDIAFVRKSELTVYGSHDAVKEKLSWIEKNISPEAKQDVIANIVLAKKVLKDFSAYKKQEHGGMGGIGVENWILAHGGNFEKAARAFWDAAHDESGGIKGIGEFKSKYHVIDPGINVKFQGHDDFIGMLKDQGYTNMIQAFKVYFGWE